jgi:hypothetical protein
MPEEVATLEATEETVETQEVEETETDASETEAAEEATETTEGPSLDEVVKLTDKQAKEITRLKAQLASQRKAERESGDTQRTPERPKAEPKQAYAGVEGHPALRGQTPDADGDVYIDGEWVNAKAAIREYEREQKIESLQKRLDEQDSAKEQAAELQAQQEMASFIESAVVSMGRKAIPGLPDEVQGDVDEYIVAQAGKLIGKQIEQDGGKWTGIDDKVIQQAAQSAVEKAMRLFGSIATKQLQGNAQAREQHRVKPDGGQAGVKGDKPFDQMTEREQNAYIQALASKANATVAATR